MPSMFERTTKKLVKEIGDQELRPVKSWVSATKTHPFSLIRKKKARSRFWQIPDVPLGISLKHILEPGSSVPDAAVEVLALFSDTVVRKQQAAGSVNAGAEVGFSEETAACRGSSLEYQIVSIPHETWPELQKRKLLDPEPDLLKQCREARVNLYVVTDTVELLNSPVLQDFSSKKILGKFSLPLNILVKGEAQGGGLKVREKKLTVPKGSVLAYKRKQLVFYGREWHILHIADRDHQETFPTRDDDDDKIFSAGNKKPSLLGIGDDDDDEIFSAGNKKPSLLGIGDDDDDDEIFSAGNKKPSLLGIGDDDDDDEIFSAGNKKPSLLGIGDDDDDDEIFSAGNKKPSLLGIGDDDDDEIFSAGNKKPSLLGIGDEDDDEIFSAGNKKPSLLGIDFKMLQEEVSQNVKAAELSKDMQNIVFSNLLAMLGDCKGLQDLMDKLEQETFGHLDGPGSTILTELRKDSCHPGVGSKCLILYLLEALMVLSDIQHVLLAQSMEKRILPLQRDLVRSILEPNFNCSENTPFTLRPELLAPLQGEDLAITYKLLDECGLEMELNSPGSTWDPEAKEPLSALYAALSVLRKLAEA